jgi:cation:H+ antiporter
MVQGGPAVQFGVVVLSVVGLWVGARALVGAAVRLARRAGLSDLTVGLTVVAAGTSAPELAVSLDAAFKRFGDIAAANVVGSNVYNLAFVLGVVALVRAIPVAESVARREGVVLLASTAVGGAALADLTVSRAEGAALAGLYVAYTAYLLRSGGAAEDGGAPGAVADRPSTFRGRDAAFLVGGLALVLVSGDAMVAAASALATGAGVSESVVGGTVVAAGTSTPEFAVSLVAVRRGSLGVSVGNVVGSNVFNVTAVVGLAALVRPLAVSPATLETLSWLAVVTVLLVAALWTGRTLSRPEGALFAGSEVGRWVLGVLGVVG